MAARREETDGQERAYDGAPETIDRKKSQKNILPHVYIYIYIYILPYLLPATLARPDDDTTGLLSLCWAQAIVNTLLPYQPCTPLKYTTSQILGAALPSWPLQLTFHSKGSFQVGLPKFRLFRHVAISFPCSKPTHKHLITTQVHCRKTITTSEET